MPSGSTLPISALTEISSAKSRLRPTTLTPRLTAWSPRAPSSSSIEHSPLPDLVVARGDDDEVFRLPDPYCTAAFGRESRAAVRSLLIHSESY